MYNALNVRLETGIHENKFLLHMGKTYFFFTILYPALSFRNKFSWMLSKDRMLSEVQLAAFQFLSKNIWMKRFFYLYIFHHKSQYRYAEFSQIVLDVNPRIISCKKHLSTIRHYKSNNSKIKGRHHTKKRR